MFIKDPDAIKDYEIDWSAWLGVDTISTSVWTVPTGLTKGIDSKTTTTTTVWLSGGTAGVSYDVVNRITTAGGRTEDQTITIFVSESPSTRTWYTTRAALKARLGGIPDSDTVDDAKIDSIIPAICRAIDGHCWRSFYVDAADATRYFTADAGDRLFPGDFVSITTLATDDTGDRTYSYEWAATDYDKEPFNAALYGLPYTSIRITPNGDYLFPTFQKGVKIIGKFGWPSVPDAIVEATLLAAEKLFKRKDAIFGVVGGGGLGELKQMMKDDPELWLLLNPYRKADVQALGF